MISEEDDDEDDDEDNNNDNNDRLDRFVFFHFLDDQNCGKHKCTYQTNLK